MILIKKRGSVGSSMRGDAALFGELRSILARAPSRGAWRSLVFFFERYGESHPGACQQVWLPYAHLCLDRWPARLRRAPARWIEHRARDHTSPFISLARVVCVSAAKSRALMRILSALDGQLLHRLELEACALQSVRAAKRLRRFLGRARVAELVFDRTRCSTDFWAALFAPGRLGEVTSLTLIDASSSRGERLATGAEALAMFARGDVAAAQRELTFGGPALLRGARARGQELELFSSLARSMPSLERVEFVGTRSSEATRCVEAFLDGASEHLQGVGFFGVTGAGSVFPAARILKRRQHLTERLRWLGLEVTCGWDAGWGRVCAEVELPALETLEIEFTPDGVERRGGLRGLCDAPWAGRLEVIRARGAYPDERFFEELASDPRLGRLRLVALDCEQVSRAASSSASGRALQSRLDAESMSAALLERWGDDRRLELSARITPDRFVERVSCLRGGEHRVDVVSRMSREQLDAVISASRCSGALIDSVTIQGGLRAEVLDALIDEVAEGALAGCVEVDARQLLRWLTVPGWDASFEHAARFVLALVRAPEVEMLRSCVLEATPGDGASRALMVPLMLLSQRAGLDDAVRRQVDWRSVLPGVTESMSGELLLECLEDDHAAMLVELDLRGVSCVNDEVARELARCQNLCGVRRLDLRGTKISRVGARAIIEGGVMGALEEVALPPRASS